MQQSHADLRSEAGAEAESIFNGVDATFRKIERAQFGIDFFEVSDRRHGSSFEGLHGQNIFHSGAHGVSGESFGVGDHDLVGAIAEDLAQRVDLRCSAAAASRRVSLVRNEDCAGSDLVAIYSANGFGFADQLFHNLTDVANIEPSTVEGAVRRDRAQHFADRLQAAFAHRFGTLDHQTSGAHADDHAVTASVEGDGGCFDILVRCSRAAGQETGAEPWNKVVGGDIVGGDYHHAAATAGPDPIFCQAHGLRGAGAGSVDGGVRPTGSNEFGKLRVAHGEHAEQESAIKNVALLLDLIAKVFDAMVDFLGKDRIAVRFGDAHTQTLECGQLLAAGEIG